MQSDARADGPAAASDAPEADGGDDAWQSPSLLSTNNGPFGSTRALCALGAVVKRLLSRVAECIFLVMVPSCNWSKYEYSIL